MLAFVPGRVDLFAKESSPTTTLLVRFKHDLLPHVQGLFRKDFGGDFDTAADYLDPTSVSACPGTAIGAVRPNPTVLKP